MSKLYATIDSDTRKTQAASRGHKRITMHAASWNGAVRVDMWVSDNGETRYTVSLVPWHGAGETRELADGAIS